MDTHRQNNGWQTFLEHYWFLVIGVSAVLASQVLGFLWGLTGRPWIWCYAEALFFAGAGVGLIFYSKIPIYRQRRFFTFGSEALPMSRRSFYRWGYRCVIFAVALLLCLLVSSP